MGKDCVECGTSPLVKAGNSYYTCAPCVKAKRSAAVEQTPNKRVSAKRAASEDAGTVVVAADVSFEDRMRLSLQAAKRDGRFIDLTLSD